MEGEVPLQRDFLIIAREFIRRAIDVSKGNDSINLKVSKSHLLPIPRGISSSEVIRTEG